MAVFYGMDREADLMSCVCLLSDQKRKGGWSLRRQQAQVMGCGHNSK